VLLSTGELSDPDLGHGSGVGHHNCENLLVSCSLSIVSSTNSMAHGPCRYKPLVTGRSTIQAAARSGCSMSDTANPALLNRRALMP